MVTLYLDAHSRQSSADIFSEVVGFNPGVENATDLIFQVNRRSDFSGVEGNRVTTVNVMETQSFRVVGGGLPRQNLDYGVGVTLDFNTVPDGRVFEDARQKEVIYSILDDVESAADCEDLRFLKG